MKYAFKFAKLPNRQNELLQEIDITATRLAEKMERLNLEVLNISDYNKKYFGDFLNNIRKALQLRTYLLAWSMQNINVPKSDIVFVDYGGGSGLLSILAKEYGIGTVIYNDIYDVSCRDAEIIATALASKADYYVEGDIDELISFIKSKQLSCSAIASYDVLEHIYDVNEFLPKLGELSDGNLNILMASGANIMNPSINKVLEKKQVYLELQDREPAWGSKNRDSLRSYLSIRKNIITEFLTQENRSLPAGIIDELASRTRGMIKKDIEKAMSHFLQTGQLPEYPAHPTNTCDPYTGNWAEHLMDPYDLAGILKKAGFDSSIIRGYYGDSNHPAKKAAGRMLNFAITSLGKKGIRFAPFFGLYGRKKAKINSAGVSSKINAA
jgi:hypothetical protein